VAWSGDAFVAPFANLGLGVLIAVALGVILARFIPRGWVWDRLVLSAAVDATAQGESGPAAAEPSLLGARGLAVTDLRPGGQVEIAGRRYEAKVEVGAIDAGAPIVVRGHSDFGLVVERAES
jgi:membrane-bound serine protease (ClpP class)